jgi:hypothetical protein
VADSLEAAGFNLRYQIVWDKTRLVIGRGDYHWQHEPAWYAVRKGRKGHWAGDRKQTTVWAIPHRKSASGHSTEKPVECMKRPIENNSSPGHWGCSVRRSGPERIRGYWPANRDRLEKTWICLLTRSATTNIQKDEPVPQRDQPTHWGVGAPGIL